MVRPVALVTGAGSGIGLATALRLAGDFDLALVDSDGQRLEEVRSQLPDNRNLAFCADISSEKDMRAASAALTARFGRLDAIVANAGINGVWAPIDDLLPEEWDRTVRVNLRGTYLTLHVFVPMLKVAGKGSIVIVSSINGVRSFTTPGATAYSATKAAQVAMAQQLALELGRHSIRVNVICPGAIATEISVATEIRRREETEIPVVWPEGTVPLTAGEPGNAADVAETVHFLLSDSARHITGSPLFVDGGQGLLR